MNEHDERRGFELRPTETTTSDYAFGICLLLVVVILWTVSGFLTQYLFISGYQKPFMITYLSTASFALYLLPSCLRNSLKGVLSCQSNVNYQPLAQYLSSERELLSSRKVDGRLTPEETAKLATYFCFLWFIAEWTINAALVYTSVTSATVLSSMSGIFTLGVGRIFRVETLTSIKIAAVLASFGGVVLVSLSDSSSSLAPKPATNVQPVNPVAILGDILALFSALFYAAYLMFLKLQIKEESRIDMQLFFGYVGLLNILLCWPVGLLLHWFGVEPLGFPDTKEAVLAILVNVFVTLSSNYIYVMAMLKTTPLVVTLGLSLTIPLAVIGDYFFGKPATFQALVGAVFVIGAPIAVGIGNSKPTEDDSLLARDPTSEGMGQPRFHVGEAIPLELQTNEFNA